MFHKKILWYFYALAQSEKKLHTETLTITSVKSTYRGLMFLANNNKL